MRSAWLEPYRGSRYSFGKDGISYKIPMSNYKVMASNCSESLLNSLMTTKPTGGSFRVTETKEIITKVPKNDAWEAIKVCDYDDSIKFKNVNLDPDKSLRSSDLWPGFYYRHGTVFSLSFLDGIFIPLPFGKRCWVLEPDMDLIRRLRAFIPRGGRFYVNENGHIWTNTHAVVDWNRTEEQIKNFSSRQKTLLNQRYEAIGRYPVYVGKWDKKIALDLEDFEPSHIPAESDDYEN